MGMDQSFGIGGYIEVTPHTTTIIIHEKGCRNKHKNQNGVFCSQCGEALEDVPVQTPYEVDAQTAYYNWQEEFEGDETVEVDDIWYSPDCTPLIIHQESTEYVDDSGVVEINEKTIEMREKFLNNPQVKHMTDYLDKQNIKYKVGFGAFSYWS